jgi:hypothetical protein
MQWSRIGLSSMVMVGLLSVTGVASADTGEDYSYSGSQIQDIPAGPYGVNVVGRHYGVVAPGYYRSCHRMRYHHGRHHYYCPMYEAFYVCQKYTYEVTPQHRDVACSQWKVEWKRVHHWRRHHAYK